MFKTTIIPLLFEELKAGNEITSFIEKPEQIK